MIPGEATGVGVLSSGEIVVFHRGGRRWEDPFPKEPIAVDTFCVIREGHVVRAFGAGRFVMPHGLRVDARDHLWVTDLARQQVIELDPSGEELRVFGGFDQPTDVAVHDDGFFVSDGYRTPYVIDCDRDGKVRRKIGGFRLPHGIARDGDRVYVAERFARRIAIVEDGRVVDAWANEAIGEPFGLEVVPGGDLLVVGNGLVRLSRTGEVRSRVGALGHSVALDRDGVVHVVDTHRPVYWTAPLT